MNNIILLSSLCENIKEKISLQKFYYYLLISLPIISILGDETKMTNFYILTLYISVLIFIGIIIHIKNKYELHIGKIEIILFLITCISLISCIFNKFPISKYVYYNLITIPILIFISAPIIQKYKSCFCKDIFNIIICINFIVIILLSLNKEHNIINYHLGNDSIASIILSISTCILACKYTERKKRLISLIYIIIISLNCYYIYKLNCRTAYFIIIFSFLFNKSYNKYIKLLITGAIITIFLFLFINNNTKNNSTLGRAFIIKNAFTLSSNNFIYGNGGFDSFSYAYPKMQAKYFNKNRSFDKNHLLADNVIYAYNEFIQALCEIGIMGVFLIIYGLVHTKKMLQTEQIYYSNLFMPLILSAFFTYTFHITIFCSLLILSLVLAASLQETRKKFYLTKTPLLLIISAITIYNIQHLYKSIYINKILTSKDTQKIDNDLIINEFNENKKYMYLFANLYKGENKECINNIKAISKKYINSDLIFLEAKKLIEIKHYNEAKNKLIFASNICPNRFRYRYELFKTLLKLKNISQAEQLARFIINMPIKINSPAIKAIKLEVEDFLNQK